MTLKAQAIKEKKLNFIKIENFGASKGIINKVKEQPTEWEGKLANRVSD